MFIEQTTAVSQQAESTVRPQWWSRVADLFHRPRATGDRSAEARWASKRETKGH